MSYKEKAVSRVLERVLISEADKDRKERARNGRVALRTHSTLIRLVGFFPPFFGRITSRTPLL